ncbi:MAG: Sec-independent protein translocase protein TatB [Actinomycetota bacterium]
MPQIGPLELMVVAVIALVVFGPSRLPEMARTVGKAMSEFKRQAADLKGQFDADLDDDATSAPSSPAPETSVPGPAETEDSVPGPVATEDLTPATGSDQTQELRPPLQS